jgi:hypothetical protein
MRGYCFATIRDSRPSQRVHGTSILARAPRILLIRKKGEFNNWRGADCFRRGATIFIHSGARHALASAYSARHLLFGNFVPTTIRISNRLHHAGLVLVIRACASHCFMFWIRIICHTCGPGPFDNMRQIGQRSTPMEPFCSHGVYMPTNDGGFYGPW